MALAREPEEELAEFRFLTREEGRAFFDAEVRKLLDISGDEFLRRFDAGQYDDVLDDADHRDVLNLVMLAPFGR